MVFVESIPLGMGDPPAYSEDSIRGSGIKPPCTTFSKRLLDCIALPVKTAFGLEIMSPLIQDFSMKLAYFVLMGGYALDYAPEDSRVLPVTITPSDFVRCYENNSIKNIYLDAKSIEDKAKVDGLAKFLVCMQRYPDVNH